MHSIGIDIGSTSAKVAVIEASSGEIKSYFYSQLAGAAQIRLCL